MWGPEVWGPEAWAEWWGSEGCGPRFFSPLPPQFSFFLPSLGVFSRNFGGVFEGQDGAPKPGGVSHDSPRTQTWTFQGPGASNTTKIPRQDLQEREKERKWLLEREKKALNFGRSSGGGFRVRGSWGGERRKKGPKGYTPRRLKTMSSLLIFCNFYSKNS